MTHEHAEQSETGTSPVSEVQPSAAEEAIAADIQITRAELGETVAQLAAKAHVGARAKHAAADLPGRAAHAVAEMSSQAKRQAAVRGQQLRGQQLSQVTDAVPDTVTDQARAVLTGARRYRAQLGAAAAVALVLFAVAVRRRRR
jgi:Protein of unknown function (DUF3618)